MYVNRIGSNTLAYNPRTCIIGICHYRFRVNMACCMIVYLNENIKAVDEFGKDQQRH